jgi:hypothetical protein
MLFTAFSPGTAVATDHDKLTYLTFSGPVQVPGATLPAGSYQFRLASPDLNREILLVASRDGKEVYAMFYTTPSLRRDRVTGDPVILFLEAGPGVKPPIRGWFYPGELTGYEFVYSKKQARSFAGVVAQPAALEATHTR